MPVVESTPDGKYLIFWRAKCRLTGLEKRFQTAIDIWPESLDVMQGWVNDRFRNLDVLEFRPWNTAEDGHRIAYPVPVQHVKFDVKIPDVRAPKSPRTSLLIKNPFGGKSGFFG